MCFMRQLVVFLLFDIVSGLAASAAAQNANALVQPPCGQVTGWHDCVHQYERAVMFVGDPASGWGTAFVISAKNRLLATNGHVADILCRTGTMVARCNGTTSTYTVNKVWYHPGVIRRHDQSLMIRCQDPSHGDIVPGCPDVAVLRLANGPELPAEFPLASPSELEALVAQPVALLGFPGSDTTRWPESTETPQASFREGTVTRLTTLLRSNNRGCKQHVQHSITAWFGSSGSPVFLPNGHVVAIDATVRTVHQNDRTAEMNFGVRIDCLWELLAYNRLTDQVALPAGIGRIDLDCYQQTDPEDINAHSAIALVSACDRLMLDGDFSLAREHCDQAILLAPSYANAFRMRSSILRESVGAAGLKPDEKLHFLLMALEDIKHYREAAPKDPWGSLDCLWTAIWLDRVAKGSPSDPQVVSATTGLLDSRVLDQTQRAYALVIRATATNYGPGCQADLDEAIRLAPNRLAGAAAYNARATFWQVNGSPAKSKNDSQRASELLKAERLVVAAQETLDRPQSTTEDFNEARETLMEACHITTYSCWDYLQLMALVQHKLGDDTAAIGWANKAMVLAPNVAKTKIRMELAAYCRNAARSAQLECKLSTNEDSAYPNRPAPLPQCNVPGISPESASGRLGGQNWTVLSPIPSSVVNPHRDPQPDLAAVSTESASGRLGAQNQTVLSPIPSPAVNPHPDPQPNMPAVSSEPAPARLVVQNRTLSSQSLSVNGSVFLVAPGRTDILIPHQVVEVYVPGRELPKLYGMSFWGWTGQEYQMWVELNN